MAGKHFGWLLAGLLLSGCKGDSGRGARTPVGQTQAQGQIAAELSAGQPIPGESRPGESRPGELHPGSATRTSSFVGFDRNDYPGDDRLAELHRSFAFAGYWLNAPPGETASSWTGKRRTLRDAGFGFLVLFNGKLEAQIKKAGGSPAALGKADASTAIAAASAEGFPKGATIFLDQEEGGRLTDPQAAYFFGWTEAVAASVYRPGAYLSGQLSPDGTGADGKLVFISTAQDVREHIAASGTIAPGKAAAPLHGIVFWVYQDACPPAPGCVLAAPRLADSGTLDAAVWQYAQSPRRPAFARSCASTYAADNLCYAGATKDLFVDLNVAASADPSSGR